MTAGDLVKRVEAALIAAEASTATFNAACNNTKVALDTGDPTDPVGAGLDVPGAMAALADARAHGKAVAALLSDLRTMIAA